METFEEYGIFNRDPEAIDKVFIKLHGFLDPMDAKEIRGPIKGRLFFDLDSAQREAELENNRRISEGSLAQFGYVEVRKRVHTISDWEI